MTQAFRTDRRKVNGSDKLMDQNINNINESNINININNK